jgi:hypothetical protein
MPSAPLTFGLDRCVTECNECRAQCVEARRYCLEQGGAYLEPRHLRLLADCAAICATTADFVLRHEMSSAWCASSCAQVCHQCADSCARWREDAVLQACTESCRTFGLMCQEIAANETTAGTDWTVFP